MSAENRNWWKYAFFVALLLFEGARELYVLQAADKGYGPTYHFNAGPGYAHASGRWIRSDGGSEIIRGTATIECRQELGICIEATTAQLTSNSDEAPDVTYFPISEFSQTSIAYENTRPFCAEYRVRLDLTQKRVTATRTVKAEAREDICSGLEKRVEMQLGDGFAQDIKTDRLAGQFVPLIRMVIWASKAFN